VKKLLILTMLVLLLVPVGLMADMGAGMRVKYEVANGQLGQGIDFMVTAFDRKVRGFGGADFAEDVNGPDKQASGGADFIYVPDPTKTFQPFFGLGGEVNWLKVEQESTTFVKGILGIGAVYQFGDENENGAYLEYRNKSVDFTKPKGENVHEINFRLIYKIPI